MRFTATAAALLGLASSVLAQTADFDPITNPTDLETIPAGSTFDIKWEPTAGNYPGDVTIQLLGGATPSTLEIIDTIASGVNNADASFEWAVGSTLGTDATYGIKISWAQDSSIFQYSFPFHIKAASGATTTTTSAAVTNNGKTTTTTSTHTLTSTITVSSGHNLTTSCANSTIAKPTHSLTHVTSISNWTTTAQPPKPTTLTSTAVIISQPSTTAAPAPAITSTVATAGAAQVAAGSLALFGGLFVALLM